MGLRVLEGDLRMERRRRRKAEMIESRSVGIKLCSDDLFMITRDSRQSAYSN